MDTKIGKSFGFALFIAIVAVVALAAMGVFSPQRAGADVGTVTVTVSPTGAGSAAQYTVVFTPDAAVDVGERIFITFNSKTTVPSPVQASSVRLKAAVTTGNVHDELRPASAVTVSGRTLEITVPDMSTANSDTGDQGIGTGSVTVIITQSAGIQNPNLAANSYTLDVSTDVEPVAVPSDDYSITASISLSASSAARGAVITVDAVGLNANCAVCTIQVAGANRGIGSIDANGVFSGSFTTSSSTATGGTVSVIDSTGRNWGGSIAGTATADTANQTLIDANANFTAGGVTAGDTITIVNTMETVISVDSPTQLTTTVGTVGWTEDDIYTITNITGPAYSQKAGATPRSAAVTPGSVVSVDLVDYTPLTVGTIASVTISGAVGPITDGTGALTSGGTGSLDPLKFTVPIGTSTGTHKVIITDSAGKAANFDLEIVNRVLGVTPNPAAIGQSFTITGTGLSANGNIPAHQLCVTGQTTGINCLNAAAITIDSTGKFLFTGRLDTLEATANSSSITVTATDNRLLVATSSGFARTDRTLTLNPETVGPGGSVNVSGTGMTVDTDESGVIQTAKVTVTASGGLILAGTTTFPVDSSGNWTGNITVPIDADAGTITITATDNARVLNLVDSSGAANVRTNKVSTAILTVPAGTVTVTPSAAPTGSAITIDGSNFSFNANASSVTIGGSSAMPIGGLTTDSTGSFSIQTTVPAVQTGGSLLPGAKIVSVKVGSITGTTTDFTIPNPTITITPSAAAADETVRFVGENFNALGTVNTITFGTASAVPSPAPRTGTTGSFESDVRVPALNPGTYTVTVSNASGFTANVTFTALASAAATTGAPQATEMVFADVIANSDNLVRVWWFNNADQSWSFYDPRPAFAAVTTYTEASSGDIVWVNVTSQQDFQGLTLFPGWNLISLD